MAVYLDLENIALGARQAKYPRFDVRKILERLLLKGHIVVKKAYCDFKRYDEFKRGLHETAFEMIEIPHVSQSGKNSADIRMVVDALDLCYTKQHVDTFVIASGDSDFSPLVSKLRENAKKVIGIGVKNSTSDLFLTNCDEFIYYDDLVRKKPVRKTVVRKTAAKKTAPTSGPSGPSLEGALEQIMETVDALAEDRDDDSLVWGSMVKQALKRRNPGFNERAHGFKSFNDLLQAAQSRGMIVLEPDQKSGGYTVRAAE